MKLYKVVQSGKTTCCMSATGSCRELLYTRNTITLYTVRVMGTSRLRRSGLTPACGFAHARSGRGFRQIDAVNSGYDTAVG